MISVCILAKNEEKNIEECLKSVIDIATEINVIDNGSTDKTVEIAKKYKCNVIECLENVDLARKKYIEISTQPWILVIDADERLGKVKKSEIHKLLENTNDDIWAYSLRSTQYIGEGKWADIGLVRLFRNNGKIYYNESSIHATLQPSITLHGKRIEKLWLYIHHVDILIKNRANNKREKYRNLLISQLNNLEFKLKDPDSYNLYKIFLAIEYIAIAKYCDAEKLLKQVISQNRRYNGFATITLCRSFLLQKKYSQVFDYLNIDDVEFDEYNDYYDKLDVLASSYYFINKDVSLQIYKKLASFQNKRPSDLINLAWLVRNNDRKLGGNLLKESVKLNPYLSRSLIYGEGQTPNIFSQQSSFLLSMPNVKEVFKEYGLEHLINLEGSDDY